MALLQQGYRPGQIAKKYQVSPAAITRALHALSAKDLLDIIALGNYVPATGRNSNFEIAPVDVEAPVDVMGVLKIVLADSLALRRLLETSEGKQLGLKLKIQILDRVREGLLGFAESFVRNREKLLKLIAIDVWMREIYEHLDAISECPHCHGDLALRDALVRRLQVQVMGENKPVEPVSLDLAEPVALDG